MKKNRPPSSAGKGKRLNTQRLILIIAITRKMTEAVTWASTNPTNIDPTPTGPEREATASFLSAGFLGAISFSMRFHINESVNRDCAYISANHSQIASTKGYL